MENRYDGLTLPIPTDALMNLIERDARDLDCYADLTTAGPGVDGLTRFSPGSKPKVRIARELSEPGKNEHRLRTTLSHEYAHVMLHSPLWEALHFFPPDGRTGPRNFSCVQTREHYRGAQKRLDGVAGWLLLRCASHANQPPYSSHYTIFRTARYLRRIGQQKFSSGRRTHLHCLQGFLCFSRRSESKT